MPELAFSGLMPPAAGPIQQRMWVRARCAASRRETNDWLEPATARTPGASAPEPAATAASHRLRGAINLTGSTAPGLQLAIRPGPVRPTRASFVKTAGRHTSGLRPGAWYRQRAPATRSAVRWSQIRKIKQRGRPRDRAKIHRMPSSRKDLPSGFPASGEAFAMAKCPFSRSIERFRLPQPLFRTKGHASYQGRA